MTPHSVPSRAPIGTHRTHHTAFNFTMVPKIVLDSSRDKKEYKYMRWSYTEEKKLWTILEVKGCDFGDAFIPDNYKPFYNKVFHIPGKSDKSGSTSQGGVQQQRKHEKAYTITITKTWTEPRSFRPLQCGADAKKKVQYIILDEESMLAFMDALPVYVEEVIPHLKEEAKDTEDVSQLSEYSTFTTTSQVRGTCKLKEFDLTKSLLDLSLVQFSPYSFGLELQYTLDGSSCRGQYLNSMVLDWLMMERPRIIESAKRLESGGVWQKVERKRTTETSPWQWPDSTVTPVATITTASDDEVEGGVKRVKLLPAASADRSEDIVSSSRPMTEEERKAFSRELDGIVDDA